MSYTEPDIARIIKDFSPGFLDTPESDTLPDGATPEGKNGWFAKIHPQSQKRRAALAKRPGMRRLTTVEAFGALEQKIDQVFEFRRSGYSPQLMAIAGGELRAYDGVSGFGPAIAGPAGFVPGNVPILTMHRDEAYIHDGAVRRRFDGISLTTPDQIAPTAAVNMTAVAPAGAGLSGTYEALYTWFDPLRDHESSPSLITPEVVLVNQARQHTIPVGSPGAAYTQWRAYVRRVDTNETKFTRVLTLAVGVTVSADERLDDLRVDLAPTPGSHDPAPTDFVMTKECAGYFVAFRVNGSDLYVSQFNQPQSYHPADVFPVGKGDGESLTAIRDVGADHWLFKGHATWRLLGERAPFRIEHVHPFYGSVGPKAGGQVDSHLYDWDRERGPYMTDGQTWVPLADGRVRALIDTANRSSLFDIRFCHFEGQGCVGWMFATVGSTRKRTLLLYSYLLGAWVTPWTGLEYASFCQFQNSAGATSWALGDEWGNVYEMFSGDRDGAMAGVGQRLSGIVLTSSSTFLQTRIDGTGLMLTSDIAGLSVAVRSATTGLWQWRRARAWSNQNITIDTTYNAPFSPVPAAGDLAIVAGIEWFQWTPWFDDGEPELQKDYHWLFLQGRATSVAHQVSVFVRFNDDEDTSEQTHTIDFATGAGGIWGTAIWNQALWNGRSRRSAKKKRFDKHAFSIQLAVMNFYPDQPITITAFGYTADRVPEALVPSA